MKKLSTRIAKKMGALSFKISGEYVHANEWPYISETEYKLHQYPWSGYPHRKIDGKDNNPWEGITTSGGTFEQAITEFNNYGIEVPLAYLMSFIPKILNHLLGMDNMGEGKRFNNPIIKEFESKNNGSSVKILDYFS